MTSHDPVCVALGMHGERLAPAAAACVASLISCFSKGRRLEVHFLYDAVSAGVRERLAASWQDSRVEIHWIDAGGALEEVADHPMRGSFLRLLIGELVPRAERLIWLDLDLLVQSDLLELWERDLGGCVAAAVPDPFGCHLFDWHGRLRSRVAPLGRDLSPSHRYFNAGVMLIDLKVWRTEAIGQRALRLFLDYPSTFEHLDQDVLNLELQDRVLSLEVEWNVVEPVGFLWEWDPLIYDGLKPAEGLLFPKIRHFAGKNKPWMKWVRRSEALWFGTVLQKTDWSLEELGPPLSRRDLTLQAWYDIQWLLVRAFWWPKHPDTMQAARRRLRASPWLFFPIALYLVLRASSTAARALFSRSRAVSSSSHDRS